MFKKRTAKSGGHFGAKKVITFKRKRVDFAESPPTVQFIAEGFNLSPNYLGDLLKVLTGQSTQQHIHDKLIEKAKEKLSTTELSISEMD